MKQRLYLPAITAVLCAASAFAGAATNEVTIPLVLKSPALAEAVPDKDGVRRLVILRGLDKISGRAIDIDAPAGVPVHFGSLTITARYCYTVPPEEPPETAAFIQIDDTKPDEAPKRVFSGWMFASTPALNGLENPVYDVWVITCKTDAPATTPGDTPPPDGSPAPAEAPNAETTAAPATPSNP